MGCGGHCNSCRECGPELEEKKGRAGIGDYVKVDYIGSLESGKVFDSSIEEEAKKAKCFDECRAYEPVTFKLGAGQMIQGFEKAVIGMKKGEEKEVKIGPEEGYGEKRQDLFVTVPRKAFEKNGLEPKEGMEVTLGPSIGVVTKVSENAVQVDFNHLLAGKKLVFKIRVREVLNERGNGPKKGI